ncbi:long-chain fatty acid--CoA ligase [Streptomyces sp. AJS327]|uniref:AMP-dependent synthetase/ligase n=1 Tax=Streptomyces sp. AJS327 TaxID=2545265 RepID=UPI0015DDBBB8|nr:AMP-dependent synthetase/ligase [Streptomyces sp. AJS327]MBA0053929.1 long-chain fatty acid--CoA ligase [Streptomyces sp. AJS327]
MSGQPSASAAPASEGGPTPEPRLVEPTKRTVGGAVREVSVPPVAPRVTSGQLGDIPFTNAVEAPDAPVLSRKEGDGWRDVTARVFAEEVLLTAKGLIASGLEPGDRVAIMSRTVYDWTLLDFAAWAAGLVTVPIYPTSSARQARHILQDSGARACFVENVEHARLLSAERGNLPALHSLWQLDTGAMNQVRDGGRHLPDSAISGRRERVGPHHAATLIYTSGTTGSPKGCVLTHGNFFAEVDNAIELLHPVFKSRTTEPASTLLFLPLSHVFGRMVAVACLRERVRLGHAPSIKTDDLLADLAGFQPTFLLGIPYVLEKVYNTARATAEKMGRAAAFDRGADIARRHAAAVEDRVHRGGPGPGLGLRAARTLYDVLVFRRIRDALGGRCRYVVCGGSPLGRRLGEFYNGAGVEIFEGYGLTETSAAATVTPPLKPRLGTVGWPLPGSAVRIADDGEVLLRGDNVFAGYWDAESQTAVPWLNAEGWFATGDLGALDEDGYLTITGRKKDVIITSGGKNLVPGPLEDWMRAHPLVSQCLVVGDDRPYVAALITLDPDGVAHWQRMHGKQHMTAKQLAEDEDLRRNLQQAVNEVNTQVSRAESIRRFTVLHRDFSEEKGHLTPSLKLKRAEIVLDYADRIDELYAR